MQSFGEFLKYVRRERGLTQDEVADKLMVVTPVVSKWENDKSIPDMINVSKLCNIYSVSVEQLNKRELKDGARVLPPENYDSVKLGKFLKKLRIKNGLSQSDVGEKLFVTGQTVSKWENGGVTTLDVLNQLAEMYSISPDKLLSGAGSENESIAVNGGFKMINKLKTAVISLSVALGVAVVLLGGFLLSTMNTLSSVQAELQATQNALEESESIREEQAQIIEDLNEIIEQDK